MKRFFCDGLLMMYRFAFFLINILFIFNLEAMRTDYLKIFDDKAASKKQISLLSTLQSTEKITNQIYDFAKFPLLLSFVNTLFDIGTEQINQSCSGIFFDKLINQQSKEHHIVKAVLFSSISYATGQKYLIPGICSHEFFSYKEELGFNADPDAHRNNEITDIFDHQTPFLGFATSLMTNKTSIHLIKYLLPTSFYPGQIICIFPLAKLGFFENKKFLHEPFSLRLAQVLSWYWDLGIEPFLYNLYIEKEKKISIKNATASFASFVAISFCKYFFYKKFLFEKTDIYEGFSTKEWFSIELISKFITPWLLSAGDDLFHEFIDTNDFLIRYLLNIVMIVGTKAFFVYFQEQNKNGFFHRYMKDFNQINHLMNNTYKKIGI